MKIPRQLVALCIVFILILAAFVTVRHFFVPKTFGLLGHYRASAIDKVREQPVQFAGVKACADCHDDIYQEKNTSYHRDLSCEVCHGPAAGHAEDPSSVPPKTFRDREHCLVCHAYDPSRPTGFPQVIPTQHNFGKICLTCHKPHNPVPPQAPGECSACHREIASQKAVSSHYALACNDCHTVPPEHLTTPRLNQVGKPSNKQSCGRCHAKDAKTEVDVPKVDIETHGGRYLCWDCHYPHSPEVKREQ